MAAHGADDRGDDEGAKKPEPCQEETEIVTGGSEDDVEGISSRACGATIWMRRTLILIVARHAPLR